eukprot:Sspe_Gene.30974::Locus_15303_Transcript_1_1_Confidence_1.000_Length_2103::g.30974::m.30974
MKPIVTPPKRRAPPVARDFDDSNAQRHLSSQIDLNTTLLQRLHEAEQISLADQATKANREALLAETRQLLNALNEENTELRDALTQARREIEALRTDINAMRGDKANTESNLKQLNYNLLYQMQEKNNLLESLQAAAANRNEAMMQQQQQMEALRTTLAEVTRERDTLKGEHSRVVSAMLAVEEQCNDTLRQYAQHVPNARRGGSVDQRLESVLDGLLGQVRALEEAVRKERHRTTVAEAQVSTLNNRLQNLETACVELRRQADTAGKEKREVADGLQREADEAKQMCHHLRRELLQARQELVSLGEESERRLGAFHQVLAEAREELVGVEAACDRAAVQCGAHQVALAALESGEEQGTAKLQKHLAEEVASIRKVVAEAESERARRVDREAALKAEKENNSRVMNQVELLQSQLHQTQKENTLLHRTTAQLQEENAELEAALKQYGSTKASMETIAEEGHRQAAELALQLQAAQTQAECLERAQAEVENDKERLTAENAKLQSELTSQREEWAIKLAELEEHLTRQQAQNDDRVAQMKAALDKMAIQLDKAKGISTVVTEHRDSLKQENERLRRDLDEVYRQAKDKTVRALAGSPHNSPARQGTSPILTVSRTASRLSNGSGTPHAVYSRPTVIPHPQPLASRAPPPHLSDPRTPDPSSPSPVVLGPRVAAQHQQQHQQHQQHQ